MITARTSQAPALSMNRSSEIRMTNDEIRRNTKIRMTNPAIAHPNALRHSGFGFLWSFVICHLSFDIPIHSEERVSKAPHLRGRSILNPDLNLNLNLNLNRDTERVGGRVRGRLGDRRLDVGRSMLDVRLFHLLAIRRRNLLPVTFTASRDDCWSVTPRLAARRSAILGKPGRGAVGEGRWRLPVQFNVRCPMILKITIVMYP
jgi:hypothetical protein